MQRDEAREGGAREEGRGRERAGIKGANGNIEDFFPLKILRIPIENIKDLAGGLVQVDEAQRGGVGEGQGEGGRRAGIKGATGCGLGLLAVGCWLGLWAVG